ncbi:MAG: HPr kinase/phosphatase C-terminal domain-containing protein [Asticcacaulis sp.]
MSKLVVHATSLSLLVGTGWRGVLILGPSGIGKSDLALRAMQAGCALVSDDYSYLWSSGDYLYAGAPDTIAGRMEIRGIGITDAHRREMTRVHLVPWPSPIRSSACPRARSLPYWVMTSPPFVSIRARRRACRNC